MFQTIVFYASYISFLTAFLSARFFLKSGKKAVRIISFALLAASVFFIYARFVEPRMLAVKNQNIEADLPDIRIAVFSDLHYGVYRNAVKISRIVEKINKENPDIVLIPGDFAYHLNENDISDHLFGIEKLNAPAFAVIGNHDIGFSRDGKDEKDISGSLAEFLEKAGIKVLRNEIAEVEIKGKKIKVAGLEDLWSGNADYGLLGKLEMEDNVIVLAHNPDAVYKFPDEIRKNIDLVVSGHTHGGQMRIPVLYKFAIPTEHNFEEGVYDIKGIKVFITSGIGMTGLPCRFLAVPRTDMINLRQ